MRNTDSTFVIIYLKGGKTIRLNNEDTISQSLLDNYTNSVKAELYYKESGETKLIDTFYGN